MNIPTTLPGLLSLAINIIIYLIIIDIILSYAIAFNRKISPSNKWVRGVRMVVNPILNPLRRILPSPAKTGGLDFSPMVAIILLEVLQNVILGSLSIGAAR